MIGKIQYLFSSKCRSSEATCIRITLESIETAREPTGTLTPALAAKSAEVLFEVTNSDQTG